jgi:hypothetical protein
MENATHLKLKHTHGAKIYAFCVLLACLSFFNHADARSYSLIATRNNIGEKSDTIAEKRVDYIEKIYFSGKNKDELNTMILTTIQDIESKPASTTAVARQYVFLTNIKDKTSAAGNSCDVEEILAAGIYGIDANEAIKQGIPKPDAQASSRADDALKSVGDLSSTTNDLALSAWTLRAGSVSSYSALGKISGGASAAGSIVNTVGSTKRLVDQTNKTLKTFGLIKDKPCKKVQPRDIQIGEHNLPVQAAGTKIIIKNISYNQVSAITTVLGRITGVSSVNTDNFSDSIVTLLIVHNMKVNELIDKIIQNNSGLNLNVESITANDATLAIK